MEDTKQDSKKNKLKHPQLHEILFMNQNNSKFEKKAKLEGIGLRKMQRVSQVTQAQIIGQFKKKIVKKLGLEFVNWINSL